MKSWIIILIVVVLLALIVGGSYATIHNTIVTKSETVRSAWSEVDVDLQRRADLIPNLVETVKGIAAQEQTVFKDIADARAALLGAQSPEDKIAANGRVDGALGRLLAIVENYPQLKSSENFLKLQDELAGTENRIAVSRKNYNDAIQDYNTYIQQFPNNLVASRGGFKRNDAYFQATEASRAVPKVQFPAPVR
jgi:LemA protein